MGTETHGKLMSSTQAVGLLAVLAVSGSVALLTFGRQKLSSHVYSTDDKPSDSLKESTPDSFEKRAHLTTTPLVNNPNADEKQVQRIVLKKVRFAPDAIEPAGDGWTNCGKSNKSADKQGHHGTTVGVSAESNSPPIKDRKCQTLAKPNLPANRWLLYKGMQRYRSMVTRDCRF